MKLAGNVGAPQRARALALAAIAASSAWLACAQPAIALDLDGLAYKVIDALPVKPHERAYARFYVKSPACAAQLTTSMLGDKVLAGMTAVFKLYRPGIAPFDINSAAQCKLRMNPVTYAFSAAAGQSQGYISSIPAPFDNAVQEIADGQMSEVKSQANAEMMKQFPFVSHVDCACEAAFHDFSPAIENVFLSIKTGDPATVGAAVATLAVETSAVPVKPILQILDGDLKGAVATLAGQYGVELGCDVGQIVLAVPAPLCKAAAGTAGKGAKFIAGIGNDVYGALAGTAADPNAYYADKWRPWLSFAAASRIGEDGGWNQLGTTANDVLPPIWQACENHYDKYAELTDVITFEDDDKARAICDAMRDQFAGGPSGGDLSIIIGEARLAARNWYETGLQAAMAKQAQPFAGKPDAIVAPSPALFGSCAKGLDPLIGSLPARNDGDRASLSDALCNELLLGPGNTVVADLKAIAASLPVQKSAIAKAKEAKKEAEALSAGIEAAMEEMESLGQALKPACDPLVRDNCTIADQHIVWACQMQLKAAQPLPVSKAKACVTIMGGGIHQILNALAPQVQPLKDRCDSIFPASDSGNRKACLKKARAALFACGDPSIASAEKTLLDVHGKPPEGLTGAWAANLVADAVIAYQQASEALPAALPCAAAVAYFDDLMQRLAKKKALQEQAAKPVEQTPGNSASAKAPKGVKTGAAMPDPNLQDGQAVGDDGAGQQAVQPQGIQPEEPGGSVGKALLKALPGLIMQGQQKGQQQQQRQQAIDGASGGASEGASDGITAASRAEADLARLGCINMRGNSGIFMCRSARTQARCESWLKRGAVAGCIAP